MSQNDFDNRTSPAGDDSNNPQDSVSGEIKIASNNPSESQDADSDVSEREPLSQADLKLKSSWSESLPQTFESEVTPEVENVTPQFADGNLAGVSQEQMTTEVNEVSSQNQKPELEHLEGNEDFVFPPQVEGTTQYLPQTDVSNLPPPKPSSSEQRLSFLKNFKNLKNGIILIFFLIILVGGGFIFYYFVQTQSFNLTKLLSFLPSFSRSDNRIQEGKSISESIVSTSSAENKEITIQEKRNQVARNISWFVPIAPSLTPTSLVATWPEFEIGSVSFHYPKEWQLISGPSRLKPDLGILASYSLKASTDDSLSDLPVEFTLLSLEAFGEVDLAKIADKVITNSYNNSLKKEEFKLLNYQALRTTGEFDNNQEVERVFVSVDDGQLIILTLWPSAIDDRVIFEQIVNSIHTN